MRRKVGLVDLEVQGGKFDPLRLDGSACQAEDEPSALPAGTCTTIALSTSGSGTYFEA